MIRIAIPIWLLAAPLASAQETTTTVKISILGENRAEEVTVGPNGGRVPYTIFVETDPLGTPENFGLARLSVTIDTDTRTHQIPISRFDPPFDGWLFDSLGCPLDDDLIAIAVAPRLPSRPTSVLPTAFRGLGQSGPQGFARGEINIPAGPKGSVFHASIYIRPGLPGSSSATVWTSVDPRSTAPAHELTGNTLTIRIGDAQSPSSSRPDLDGDGDVDLADYLKFVDCFTPPQELPRDECKAADLDGDGDVDLADLIEFQSEFTKSRGGA